jgi:hypothetical protein
MSKIIERQILNSSNGVPFLKWARSIAAQFKKEVTFLNNRINKITFLLQQPIVLDHSKKELRKPILYSPGSKLLGRVQCGSKLIESKLHSNSSIVRNPTETTFRKLFQIKIQFAIGGEPKTHRGTHHSFPLLNANTSFITETICIQRKHKKEA